MAHIMAKTRVSVALSINFPAATDSDVRIIDHVLVCREKPVNKWVGPFSFTNVDDKTILVEVNGKDR